jgi:hypothetical protein
MRLLQTVFATVSVLIIAAATAARADVTISSDATANISCAGGVCQPTASDAVLNVGDLENLLASGDVSVTTTGSGVQANNIDVTARLGWSANALTLDAYQSLSIAAPVTVSGKSGLSILTNDGGSGGELAFSGNGHVTFRKLSGRLTINGTNYTLVNSIASLAAAVTNKRSGNYALASNYNASKDGTYSSSPVATTFTGSFEGLGNRISDLTIVVPLEVSGEMTGLFARTDGAVSDIGIVAASITITEFQGHKEITLPSAGILAGTNNGSITRSFSDGTVMTTRDTLTDGLVGATGGTIIASRSAAAVKVRKPVNFAATGGLVGLAAGNIESSYASGAVAAGHCSDGLIGETVGAVGAIANSYATGSVKAGRSSLSGGLVGCNSYSNNITITTSYSTGAVSGGQAGGLIGDDQSQSGSLNDNYWDTDTSGITNLSQGAGFPPNDPGITGLSTEQLQSGVPPGFDPTVWGENANINNGLPYLLANPPK